MGLQRMTMKNAVNREFLNIQIQRGQILGNARIVVATESSVDVFNTALDLSSFISSPSTVEAGLTAI